MKVYTKVVYDISGDVSTVIHAEYYEYSGEVALCGKGGTGGGLEPDKEYNARMAALAEGSHEMAQEMFNLFKWGVPYDPNAKIEGTGGQIENPEWKEWKRKQGKLYGGKSFGAMSPAERMAQDPYGVQRSRAELGPEPPKYIENPEEAMTYGEKFGYDPDDYVSEMELMQEMLAAQSELVPHETALRKQQMQTATRLTKERGGLMSALYKEALAGVDIDKRVSEARSGVEHSFKNQLGIANRNLSRMGIDPSSGRGLALQSDIGLLKAKSKAGLESQIRSQAELENFERKRVAAGLGI